MKEVENEVFDLFCALDADDSILDYPVFYCSAKDSWAVRNHTDERKDISCILDAVIEHIPAPQVSESTEFRMLVSQIESNPYFGKMLIGRVNSGEVKVNDKLQAVDATGAAIEAGKVFKIIRRYGMAQVQHSFWTLYNNAFRSKCQKL